MTFDQLRYFVACANFEHVGRAAKSINISTSSISSAIISLEQELDVLLFERIWKRLKLTEEGHKLKIEAQSLLDQDKQLKQKVKDKTADIIGTYRIGASHSLAAKQLVQISINIQKKHPSLKLILTAMDTGQLMEDILQGRLDLGIAFNSPIKPTNIEEHILLEGQIQIMVRKNHPILKLPKNKQMSALSSYPATIHQSAIGLSGCEAHAMFDKFNIEPKMSLLYNSDDIGVAHIITKTPGYSFR